MIHDVEQCASPVALGLRTLAVMPDAGNYITKKLKNKNCSLTLRSCRPLLSALPGWPQAKRPRGRSAGCRSRSAQVQAGGAQSRRRRCVLAMLARYILPAAACWQCWLCCRRFEVGRPRVVIVGYVVTRFKAVSFCKVWPLWIVINLILLAMLAMLAPLFWSPPTSTIYGRCIYTTLFYLFSYELI